jgi:hypothetical protein
MKEETILFVVTVVVLNFGIGIISIGVDKF